MAEMWVTMGPQHPMTHGLWTLRVKVDGEVVTDTEPELGYIPVSYTHLTLPTIA